MKADLGFSASHQVFELDDLVIDGRTVTLLNGVVSRALLAFLGLHSWLTADGYTVNG